MGRTRWRCSSVQSVIPRDGSSPDPFTRPALIAFQWIATLLCVAFACVVAAFDGSGWQWLLFIWGIAAAAVALVLSRRSVTTLGKMINASPQQLEVASARQAARRKVVEPPMVGFGVVAGVLSARGWWGADLAFTIAVAFSFLVIPRLVLRLLRGRLDAGRRRAP